MKKTVTKTLFAIFLLIFFGCKKNENSDKKTLLIATQNFNDINVIERTFKIFSDSTFTFTEVLKEPNYSKNETFEGFVKIKKDTIKFFPFELKYNNAETAVLKNGFIEFVDGEYPDRMKIEKTSLFIKNNIDFNKFQNYAVFTFYKNFHKLPDELNYSNHELTTTELTKIENILEKTFTENKKLKNYSDYLKQIESIKNKKNQNLIFIRCFCKEPYLTESYQYSQIGMHDGGNCNVYIVLNLTTGKIETLNIAGVA